VVLRAPFAERGWRDPLAQLSPLRRFGGNPIYGYAGMEVTVWDFTRSRLDCVNLFSDGAISSDYLLVNQPRPEQLGERADAA